MLEYYGFCPFVVALDPGIANFGWFASTFRAGRKGLEHDGRNYRWNNERLVQGAYKLCKARSEIRKWSERNRDLLWSADLLAIEGQMAMRLINLQNAMRDIIGEYLRPGCRVVIVNPKSVKKLFDIGTGSYRGNKRAAVSLVSGVCSIPTRSKKKDDYADAFLLAYTAARMHFLNCFPHVKYGKGHGFSDPGGGGDHPALGVLDPVNPYFLKIKPEDEHRGTGDDIWQQAGTNHQGAGTHDGDTGGDQPAEGEIIQDLQEDPQDGTNGHVREDGDPETSRGRQVHQGETGPGRFPSPPGGPGDKRARRRSRNDQVRGGGAREPVPLTGPLADSGYRNRGGAHSLRNLQDTSLLI